MRRLSRLCALGLPVLLVAGSSHAEPTLIRYELGIRVIENTAADNGLGGHLATLSIGETGTIEIVAEEDPTVFPSTTPTFQAYRILEFGAVLGDIAYPGDRAFYPSTIDFFGLQINDNTDSLPTNQTYDFFGTLPQFASQEIEISRLDLLQTVPLGDEPTMIDGLGLPRQIDPSLGVSVFGDFFVESSLGDGAVFFDVFSVDVTVVPAAPTLAVVFLSGGFAVRRRRSITSTS